jgi:hypothetical protein
VDGQAVTELVAPRFLSNAPATAPEIHRMKKLFLLILVLAVAGAAGWYWLVARDQIAQKRTLTDIRNTGTAMFSWLTDQVGSTTPNPSSDPTQVLQQPAIAAFNLLDQGARNTAPSICRFEPEPAASSAALVAAVQPARATQDCVRLIEPTAPANTSSASRQYRGRYVTDRSDLSAGPDAARLMPASLRLSGSALMLQSTYSATTSIDVGAYQKRSFEDVEKMLVPRYLQVLPRTDGWGHPYEYYVGANALAQQVLLIRSPGRDGVYSASVYPVSAFEAGNHDEDIVWVDGFFARWPEKTVTQKPSF